MHKTGTNVETLYTQVNEDINSIAAWCHCNYMSLNVGKTKYKTKNSSTKTKQMVNCI